MIDCVTANADEEGRALLVGGGIANFTDVAATFKGIIQVGAGFRDQVSAQGSPREPGRMLGCTTVRLTVMHPYCGALLLSSLVCCRC